MCDTVMVSGWRWWHSIALFWPGLLLSFLLSLCEMTVHESSAWHEAALPARLLCWVQHQTAILKDSSLFPWWCMKWVRWPQRWLYIYRERRGVTDALLQDRNIYTTHRSMNGLLQENGGTRCKLLCMPTQTLMEMEVFTLRDDSLSVS